MHDTTLSNTIKTTAPRLEGVVERPRLLKALTQLTAASKWLQAPSGTGQIHACGELRASTPKPFAWYRLDERDNDPAFFFDEFERALRAQVPLAGELPKFSSDDHDRLQDFAHRFANSLLAQLATPTLLVFDDAQRITSESMQSALAALSAVATNECELLFVSEAAAPTSFFDAIAARRLSLLNDVDLHFDPTECKAITAALRIDDSQCERIAAVTGGHAAALVFACELLRGKDPQARSAPTRLSVFTHTCCRSSLSECHLCADNFCCRQPSLLTSHDRSQRSLRVRRQPINLIRL